jgi:hypothetical protein
MFFTFPPSSPNVHGSSFVSTSLGAGMRWVTITPIASKFHTCDLKLMVSNWRGRRAPCGPTSKSSIYLDIQLTTRTAAQSEVIHFENAPSR